MSQISQSPNDQWYRDRLDSMGPRASPLQQKRFAVAVDYLEANCVEKQTLPDGTEREVLDRQAVLQHLNSIDFHKDVKLKELNRDDKVYRHSVADSPMRDYYTSKGSSKDRLAITEGEGSKARVQETYFVKNKMVVLETHTRDTKDIWSEGRNVRDMHDRASSRVVNADKTSTRTPNGREIDHQLRKTDDAKIAGRVYSNNGDPRGPIEQRSGEYVRGGAIQYHIPKKQHENLCPAYTPAVAPSKSLTEQPTTRTQKI